MWWIVPIFLDWDIRLEPKNCFAISGFAAIIDAEANAASDPPRTLSTLSDTKFPDWDASP